MQVLGTRIYTHLRYRYGAKMVHNNYIVLMPKRLGGASLQLLAAHLPSILLAYLYLQNTR